MNSSFYTLQRSGFGVFGLVWKRIDNNIRIQRILLPDNLTENTSRILTAFPGSKPNACDQIEDLVEKISSFLAGHPVNFDLNSIALECCSAFQRKVLLADWKIPRGMVSSYGLIAEKLKLPGGARAVGGALSHNPFPVIIPCHRAVRNNGELGGFQGGLHMKRAFLEMEGIEFDKAGKIQRRYFHYCF